MAGEETIGRATIQLGADGSKLAPEMAAAVAKAQGTLDRANRQMERAQASTFKAIQGHIDRINATRPTNEMRMLEQAVGKLGGTANLTKDQLGRVTAQVNALAAAGAKVPASLSGLTGMGAKLGAAFQSLTTGGGVSGALAAIGPAGVAAAGALGVVTVAGGAAVRELSALASKAEEWSNIAASTGLGTTEVQQLSTLLEGAGIPAEALSKAMKELQKEIATGGKELQKFGIDISALKDLSPEEQLRAMAAQIAAIEDPADRTAVALAAFGRSGTDLLPVMDDVAKGADKMFDALSSEQVASLAKADAALDKFGQKWTFAKNIVLASIVEMVQGFKGFAPGGIPIFLPPPPTVPPKPPGTPPPGEDPDAERKRRAKEYADREAQNKRDREAEAAAKKAADDMLAVRKKYNELQASIVKRTADESGLMRDLDEQSKSILDTWEKNQKAQVAAMKEGRLRGGDMLPAVGGSGLWTRHQDVLDQEMENAAAKATDSAAKLGDRWESTLSLMATGAGLVGAAFGAAYANVLSVIQNISASFKGFSKMSGTDKFGAIAGAAGQLGGLIGGTGGSTLSGAAGGAMTGAAIGSIIPGVGTVVGGIVGGAIGAIGGFLSGNKAKKDAKKAGEILGRSVTQETAKQLKEAAKAAGMSYEAYLKKIRAEEDLQKKVEARQKVESGLSVAKSGAEGLMALLEKGGLSKGLTEAFQKLIGKVSEALLKTGLGILDGRLAKSEKFTEAQNAAATVAQVIAGMREAGFIDDGMMAAGGQAAGELRAQAEAAAIEAGMPAADATKAGFAAIAPLLREQLNASLQSGKELDANTAALLAEAKANGIEIMADPMIESLAVQKEQLVELRLMGRTWKVPRNEDGDVGAASGFGPMITPNVGGGLGPRIQTHPGELAMVIPRSKMGPGGILSAAAGLYSDVGRGRRRGAGSSTSINLNIAEDPFQTSEGRMRLRRHTLRTVERQTSKKLGALIASGRA